MAPRKQPFLLCHRCPHTVASDHTSPPVALLSPLGIKSRLLCGVVLVSSLTSSLSLSALSLCFRAHSGSPTPLHVPCSFSHYVPVCSEAIVPRPLSLLSWLVFLLHIGLEGLPAFGIALSLLSQSLSPWSRSPTLGLQLRAWNRGGIGLC